MVQIHAFGWGAASIGGTYIFGGHVAGSPGVHGCVHGICAAVDTPARVLMGGSDSVAYCQATVQAMFDDILYRVLLIWLDGLLGYAHSSEALLDLLTRMLRICHEKGLKLNPKKCSFY